MAEDTFHTKEAINETKLAFKMLYEVMNSVNVPKELIHPKKICRGLADAYVPIFEFLFCKYDIVITAFVFHYRRCLPNGKRDNLLTFLQQVWTLLTTYFDYHPLLSVEQFITGEFPIEMMFVLSASIRKVRVCSHGMSFSFPILQVKVNTPMVNLFLATQGKLPIAILKGETPLKPPNLNVASSCPRARFSKTKTVKGHTSSNGSISVFKKSGTINGKRCEKSMTSLEETLHVTSKRGFLPVKTSKESLVNGLEHNVNVLSSKRSISKVFRSVTSRNFQERSGRKLADAGFSSFLEDDSSVQQCLNGSDRSSSEEELLATSLKSEPTGCDFSELGLSRQRRVQARKENSTDLSASKDPKSLIAENLQRLKQNYLKKRRDFKNFSFKKSVLSPVVCSPRG